MSAPAPATSNHRANNTVCTNGAGINPYIKHNLNRPQKTTQNQPQKRRQLPPVNEATTFSQKHSAMKIPMPISGRKNELNNSLSMMLLHLLSPIAAPSQMAIPRTVSPREIITQCCNLTCCTSPHANAEIPSWPTSAMCHSYTRQWFLTTYLQPLDAASTSHYDTTIYIQITSIDG